MQKKLFSKKSKGITNLLIQNETENLLDYEGGSANPSMAQCLFPTKKVPATFLAAEKLRSYMILLFLLEIVYICLELFVYGQWTMILYEIPRCWLCYYGYMTLSLCCCYIYMVWVVIGAVLSVLSVFSVGLHGGLLALILFPTQLVVMCFSGYMLWFKI